MKRFYIFYIFAFMCLNTYGQSTYSGKIIYMPNPCLTEPCLPGMVFGLETTSQDYVLTINSNWIWSNNRLIIGDVEYFIDDEVEIIGITTTKQDLNFNEYTEIEIKQTITSNVEFVSLNKSTVYYDAIKQIIVIETLRNKPFTFELVNMQGKVILRKTNVCDTISVAKLPIGVYVYRLLENKQVICNGKILKDN